ncbi:helix-turn-helix domain-containing protein [Haloarcula salina]|uniref:helix-turn-helix domain-containing protein n=1 Tax=Haloarcula salina TaxID=1429914 RepID=UPI003C6FDFA5
MKYLHLRIRYERAYQHPMQRLLTDCDDIERSWLVTWNLQDEGDVLRTLFYIIGDRERYEREIAAAEQTIDYDITPVHEGTFYAYVREREMEIFKRFRAAFARPSLVVVPPLAYRPHGIVDFDVVGEPADLERVLDELPDEISAQVSEVGEYDVQPGAPADNLTSRQREAVRAALDVGYYEVPRVGSVADVAERLGCATSTASNHLQKAEGRLVRQFVGGGAVDALDG